MNNVLTRKLECFEPLSSEDRKLLTDAIRGDRPVAAHVDLIHEGDDPEDVHLILSGMACRYKMLPNGLRRIVALLLPGDLCDTHGFFLRRMDHSIATLTPCTVVNISRGKMLELARSPGISRALWWSTLVDEAILREWLVNWGGRPSVQRIAHFLCELLIRLETVGLSTANSYELALTQTQLADATGMTNVHMNRVLQALRHAALIEFRGGSVTVLNRAKLEQFSGFDPNYLHIERALRAEAS